MNYSNREYVIQIKDPENGYWKSVSLISNQLIDEYEMVLRRFLWWKWEVKQFVKSYYNKNDSELRVEAEERARKRQEEGQEVRIMKYIWRKPQGTQETTEQWECEGVVWDNGKWRSDA